LESGPAAGALSAGFWGARAGHKDVLAFDMGGTTAKACLIERGSPLLAREHETARVYRFAKGSGLPVRVPVIDLIEIGAGGGSVAGVGPFGLPKVGPDSTGAEPGPACYGLGGREPTVTDADLLLGYLNPGFFLGGVMALDEPAALSAVGRLASRLELAPMDAAAAIHRVVNENMASAARMHAVERGRDLRRFAMVATGGAGPVHAWGVARALGIRTLVFPPSAGVASAFGMLTAAAGFEFAMSLPAPLGEVRWGAVRKTVAGLVENGKRLLAEGGVEKDSTRVELAADVRHRGQGEALTIELGAALTRDPRGQVERAFEAAYTRLYGRRPPGVDTEVLTWRVQVLGPVPRMAVRVKPGPPGSPRKGSRSVWFSESGRFARAAVYDRYRLRSGATITGPAVIEERESTTVIGPGGKGRLDPFGNLVVRIP
jgi:N-methylhydantoinase A/oxoprolinase/acetone carboxylase beta subunit